MGMFLPKIIILCLLVGANDAVIPEGAPGSCIEYAPVEVYEQVCTQKPVVVTYPGKCGSGASRRKCTIRRTEWRTVCNYEYVTKNQSFLACCDGYHPLSSGNETRCHPICTEPCVFGSCTSPEQCSCQAGYTDKTCSSVCPENTFGLSCEQLCECENGATCNHISGSCSCAPGYIGTHCESSCEQGFYGQNCSKKCDCHELGTESCNHQDGSCSCYEGFMGKICDFDCSLYGGPCPLSCPCLNSDSCLPNDKGCVCSNGWTGEFCEQPCPEGFWGPNCTNECHVCHNGGSCDRFTGDCQCAPGYEGDQCEHKCNPGWWGPACRQKCNCYYDASCDHVDGICMCNEFQSGSNCQYLDCPEGKFGVDCSKDCRCENEGKCASVDGSCSCAKPGFYGRFCNRECHENRFGLNCGGICKCESEEECKSDQGCTNKYRSVRGAGDYLENNPRLTFSLLVGQFAVAALILHSF